MKRLVVIAILFAVYWFVLSGGCGSRGAIACPPAALEEGVGTTLSSAEACRDAGYLCVQHRTFRVERWPLTQGKLRVRVPLPDLGDKALAVAIRDAAVEGIQAWDGHPFPIVIDTAWFPYWPWDIILTWSYQLQTTEAGFARRNAYVDGKRMGYSVPEMIVSAGLPREGTGGTLIVTTSGGDQQTTELTPEYFQAHARVIAMHEMGHALGLEHSDRPGDIMFRSGVPRGRMPNQDMSDRDLQTVDALYRLPNGAQVQ